MLKAEVNTNSPFYKLGEDIANRVFADDYYKGSWWITLKVEGKHKVKICNNYTTALGWANYFKRNGYDAFYDGILIGKNYHGSDKEKLFRQLKGHFGYK